jgi:putative salt-induced outer membrane protein
MWSTPCDSAFSVRITDACTQALAGFSAAVVRHIPSHPKEEHSMPPKSWLRPAASLLALAMALPALAQEKKDPAPGEWTGSAELGLAMAKGNSDSTTLVGKFNAKMQEDNWRYSFGGAFQYAEADEEETSRRYELFTTAGYSITDRSYWFSSLRNERDQYAVNEYQWTYALGYGIDAVKNDRTKLTFEVGPGYRWSKLQNLRVHENELIARGFMDFSHQFTDTTSVYDRLLIESGSENTFIKNELGVQVSMTQALALKVGLEARHNTNTLPDTKKTDTLTTANVVYAF